MSGIDVGASVRVRTAYPTGHCRTPYYCRGKSGVVERICGDFRNPETLAYGEEGEPKLTLYRVRFSGTDLWADAEPGSVVEIELYENWLEAV